jgi:hypothetical protein
LIALAAPAVDQPFGFIKMDCGDGYAAAAGEIAYAQVARWNLVHRPVFRLLTLT